MIPEEVPGDLGRVSGSARGQSGLDWVARGPHDFLPLEPASPALLALRNQWVSCLLTVAESRVPGVPLPPPTWGSRILLWVSRGTERDWGGPGRSQKGDPYIRTWEDSTDGESSDFEETAPLHQKHPVGVRFPVKE